MPLHAVKVGAWFHVHSDQNGTCVFFLNLQTKTWNKIYIRFTSGFDFNACHDYHCLSDIEKQRLHLERGRGGRKEKKH